MPVMKIIMLWLTAVKNLLKKAVNGVDSLPLGKNNKFRMLIHGGLSVRPVLQNKNNIKYKEDGGCIQKQTGAALVIIIVSVTIVAIMGTGILSLISSSTFSESFITNRHRAYYLAQAGRKYATMFIYNYGAQAAVDQLSGKEFNVAEGNKFYLSLTKDESRTYVESTGIVGKNNAAEAKQKVKFTVESVRFSKEVFGVETISVSSRAFIDSYDSRLGPYSTTNMAQDAVVQSILISSGAITVMKDGAIYGNAVCGVNCGSAGNPPITSAITIYGTLTGTRSAALSTPVVDPVEIPAGGEIYPSVSNPRITTTTTLGVTGETRLYRTGEIFFTKTPTKILTIRGKVTLVVDDTLAVTNPGNVSMDSGKIFIEPGGELFMYVTRTLTLLGNSIINPPCRDLPYPCASPSPATSARILGIQTTNLNFSGASETWGGVNAPGAVFALASESKLYGTVVARTITLSGAKTGCAMHVDKSFAATGGGTSGSNISY